MSDQLKIVRTLEERLRKELEGNPTFAQWLSVKTTLDLLSNGVSANGMKTPAVNGYAIPDKYTDDLTWRDKVMFAMSEIKEGYIPAIISELKKNGEKKDDDFLQKRVSVTASGLREDGYLRRYKTGKQVKYFLK